MAAIDNVYELPHLAAVLVSGLDAEKFLQSQLSSNVAALESGSAQFSSWCAANGRVIGLGWLFRTADGFCWIVAVDTVEAIITGLNKYRLRSKVSIAQADPDSTVFGSDVAFSAAYSAVRLADGRGLGFGNTTDCQLAPKNFLGHWLRRDIELKIPWNGGGERFLPQMLGIERFAGLSLKKGCFPGQEVISRLHYKGVLKRNLRVLDCDQSFVLGRFLCVEAQDEIEVIQPQATVALAVVGCNLPQNFSITRDGVEIFCRTIGDEFVEAL